jgi:hypothetical protein
MNAIAKTTWAAPRWVGFESFVKDTAFILGLKCQTEVDKGWLCERGRVEVQGEAGKCRQFLEEVSAAANSHNGG